MMVLLGGIAMKNRVNELLKRIRNNILLSAGLLMVGFGVLDGDGELTRFGIFMAILGVLFDDSDEED